MVREEWERSAEIRKEVVLNAFVVMPNHVHGIVLLLRDDAPDAGVDPQDRRFALSSRSLGAFIGGFKSAVTTRTSALRKTPSRPV
jgi:putative transposase